MSEWQPMKTAPKDSWILLFCPDIQKERPPGGVYIGAHYKGNEWEIYNLGSVFEMQIGGWMPLPTPPQEGE